VIARLKALFEGSIFKTAKGFVVAALMGHGAIHSLSWQHVAGIGLMYVLHEWPGLAASFSSPELPTAISASVPPEIAKEIEELRRSVNALLLGRAFSAGLVPAKSDAQTGGTPT
jgi:hypothetical protein